MDKISKALNIARNKRQSLETQVRTLEKESIQVEQDSIVHGVNIKSFTPDALTLEKNRILNSASREEIIQPYKVLRTRLIHILQEKNWSSVAVLSPTKDDGKTTVAINLAISIGNSRKHNAVLLDLDLLTPSICSYYGYKSEYGLEDYFESGKSLQDIIVSPDMEGLIIAPAMRQLHDSSEYLSTSKGAQLINDADSLIDNSITIVDLPPVLASDDAIAFIPHVDAVLLVIREGKTSKQDIERTLEMLENANIAGVVMNDSKDPATLGYYY